VFCWKPAPVQVSWLGYCARTGLNEMDYIIGDANTIPKELDNQFTEKVWRLPELYICLTSPDIKNEVAALPALKNGYITYGSFNNLTKMNDEVVALWAKILEAVPNSQLLLKAKQLDDMSVRENVLKRFALANIKGEQIILKGMVNREKHFKAYNEVDIAFDPFPYQGVTTSFESLWMGVPVLTLAGDCFVSRQGIGILRNAGLPDWVADDKEEYVAKAIDFASDIGGLAKIRAGLRAQVLASPLFNAQRFAKNFEDAVWQMWRHYQFNHAKSYKR
jgi:predicted O-linked N-acetylglucosamine transferase (SPINDLY family)